MTNNQSTQQTGLLRLAQVLEIIPVGRSTWWAGVKCGRYPKSVKIGRRITAWRTEDIDALKKSFSGSGGSSSGAPAAMTPPIRTPLFSDRGEDWVERLCQDRAVNPIPPTGDGQLRNR